MLRSWLNGCCVGLALAGWALPLNAQEPVPPPVRRSPAPPRRGERVDRLRKLGGQLVESLAGDPQQASKPVDVSRLNEAIGLLLEPLLGQERALESFHIGFDPAATDFARDTIKLQADARLRQTGWSTNPTQVNIGVVARMARGQNGVQQAILGGELNVATEVIPLANRAIERLLSRAEPARSAGGRPLSADDEFKLRLREKLQSTPPLASMDDLVDLAVAISGMQLTARNDEIERLKQQVAAARDDRERAPAQMTLNQARLARDQMFDIHPHVDHDEQGHAVALIYAMQNSSVPAAGRVNQFEVVIREREIHVVGDGTLLQGVEFYALFKPVIMNTLERLQNRDPDTFRLGRGMIRDSLSRARPLLFGDAPPPAAEEPLPGPVTSPPRPSNTLPRPAELERNAPR